MGFTRSRYEVDSTRGAVIVILVGLVMFIGLLCYFQGLRWFCSGVLVVLFALYLLHTSSPSMEVGAMPGPSLERSSKLFRHIAWTPGTASAYYANVEATARYGAILGS